MPCRSASKRAVRCADGDTWSDWHDAYDDPESALIARLAEIPYSIDVLRELVVPNQCHLAMTPHSG